MTPYRDRLEAGEYDSKKTEKKAPAKKAATTKKSSAKSSGMGGTHPTTT